MPVLNTYTNAHYVRWFYGNKATRKTEAVVIIGCPADCTLTAMMSLDIYQESVYLWLNDDEYLLCMLVLRQHRPNNRRLETVTAFTDVLLTLCLAVLT